MYCPGEKLIIKLWETLVDKGVGNLLKPTQIRREGDAMIDVKTKAITAIAEAEKEAEIIKNSVPLLGYEGGEQPPANNTIAKQIEDAATIEAIRKETNVTKAIIHAHDELENDSQEPSSDDIDDDWLYRWRDNAANVSSEKLQQLWGRVLAGESKSPGTYSLRTMEFLRSITQEEAMLIENVAQFVIATIIARNEMNILEKNGVFFKDILCLQELGVVSGAETSGMKMTYKSDRTESYQKVLSSNGRALLILHDDSTKLMTIQCYLLTAVGKQVMKLGRFKCNDEYLRSIGKKIHGQGYKVMIGDWEQINGNSGNFSNDEELSN